MAATLRSATLILLLAICIVGAVPAPADASALDGGAGIGRRLLTTRKLLTTNNCPWGPYYASGHYQWGGSGETHCPGQGSCVGKECFINSWMAQDQGPVTSARVNQLYFYAWQPFNYGCP